MYIDKCLDHVVYRKLLRRLSLVSVLRNSNFVTVEETANWFYRPSHMELQLFAVWLAFTYANLLGKTDKFFNSKSRGTPGFNLIVTELKRLEWDQ